MVGLLQYVTFQHYTKKLPHVKLKSKHSSIVDFAFQGEDNFFISLSK